MSYTSGLTIRQHERAGVRVPVEVILCDAHRGQVRFSASSSALDRHTLRSTAVDISPGGMGLECRHFLPRMCEAIVRVFEPGTSLDEMNVTPPLLEQRVKVRRVYLVGREPLYMMGTAFVELSAEAERAVASLIDRLMTGNGDAGAESSAAAGKGGRHA